MTKPKPKPKAKPQPKKSNSGSNTEHAKLSPSHFETNLRCPASLTMEHGLPNESSQAAAEGTAMHHVAECVLVNWLHNPQQNGGKDAFDYVGTYPLRTANNGDTAEAKIQFTKDMAACITPYINYVKQLKTDHPDARIHLEQRLVLTDVLDLGNVSYVSTDPRTGEVTQVTGVETFGTGDLVALVPLGQLPDCKECLLLVDDLKTGRGKVYAEGVPGSRAGNYQLMGYAAAALRYFEKEGHIIKQVRLGIHGPRMGHLDGTDFFDVNPAALRIWSSTAGNAAQRAFKLLAAGKKELKAADFKPGAVQCKWCRAAKEGICPAQARAALDALADEPAQVVEVQPAAEKPKPKPKKPKPKAAQSAACPEAQPVNSSAGTEESQFTELTPDEIVNNYAKIPALKQFIESAEKAMQRLMRQGEGHPGYKIVSVPGGKRFVSDPEGLVKMLKGARFKDADIYNMKLHTPAAYERMAEDKPRVLKRLSEFFGSPENGTSIVPVDDPRPAFVQAASLEDLSDE